MVPRCVLCKVRTVCLYP